ncbi:transglutaminase domain-containing protein [Mariniflexile sp. HMF6888]|uniref:transglutaminase domain-containing protein n=1 Tax=Mariniflexile sp. HMF6888 TaxID=3373086 RepID=UPI0037B74002
MKKGHLIIALLLLTSCGKSSKKLNHALELSGNNKQELQKVLNHYSEREEDKLKYKAAVFLIENMPKKTYRTYSPFLDEFMHRVDNINNYLEVHNLNKGIDNDDLNKIWGRCKRRGSSELFEQKYDLLTINSELLIDNIDEAFLVWEKVPWASSFTFEQFCEYVLPYRSSDEYPTMWRKEINQKYNWALEKNSKKSIVEIVKQINDSTSWFKYLQRMTHISGTKISDVYKIGGGVCRQHSSLKISALRSLGIPAANVSALTGTSWVSILNEEGKTLDYGSHFAPVIGKYYQEERKRYWPKVFMDTYSNNPYPFKDTPIEDVPPFFRNINKRDVTSKHIPSSTVSVSITIDPPKETKHVFLRILYMKKWYVADWGEINRNTAIFKQMGINNIYFPSYYIGGVYYPAAKPFYLRNDGTMKLFENESTIIERVKLTRKYPLNIPERKYSNLMVGTRFEGADNPDFYNSTLLAKIERTPQIIEELKVSLKNKFRYVRYISDTLMGVAEISFLGKDESLFKGKVLHSNNINKQDAINAFDLDIRTNCNNDKGLILNIHNNAHNYINEEYKNSYLDSWIGLDFGEPKQIQFVKYLFRNSFNSVEPGAEYELFYWDDKWKSLGKKIAEQNYLFYNIPKNTVLLLKNMAGGTHEIPFFVENGEIIFSSYFK